MGYQNVKPIKTHRQRKEFLFHLLKDVKALDQMVHGDLFEKNTYRIGAEQEFCITSKDFRPSRNSLKILEKINDPHFTTELGLFNLELNLDPLILKNDCFEKMESQLSELLNKAHNAAESVANDKVVLTGILPTLTNKDMAVKNMTPVKTNHNNVFSSCAERVLSSSPSNTGDANNRVITAHIKLSTPWSYLRILIRGCA